MYAFGPFPIDRLSTRLLPDAPSTLGGFYEQNNLTPVPDCVGFIQILDIQSSGGAKIDVGAEDGRWLYSADTLFPCSRETVSQHRMDAADDSVYGNCSKYRPTVMNFGRFKASDSAQSAG